MTLSVPDAVPAQRPMPRRLRADRFEADLYRYGLKVGLALLRDRRINRALRYLVRPVPYWRSMEFRLVWGADGFRADDRILDIGSPKLLSLYIAERVGAEVHATDLDDYFVDEYAYLRRARGIAPDRFHVEVADGRALPYPDAWFSIVYSVSVIEHIPETGDSQCLREIGRVLAPGGRCLVTVPFWPTSRDVYRARDFYWADASAGTLADGRVFFQRRYSEEDLMRRLIEPSGLELRRLLYVGERLMAGNRERELGEVLPILDGPLDPLFSRLAHTRPSPSWQALRKPLCAFLELSRPA